MARLTTKTRAVLLALVLTLALSGAALAINYIDGTPYNDVLYGTAGEDWIYGYDGFDDMYGYGYPDDIYGYEGADDYFGGDGNDYFDEYNYGGNDGLSGHGGNDTMWGGPYYDRFYGGDGNDTIRAQDGASEAVNGNAGSDFCYVDRGDDRTSCEYIDFP